MGKVVFHIDVNSAFLSWEAVYRLRHLGGSVDLREIPSAVGGDSAMRRGIILAKSLPAKKYGVRTGESINEALRKCPELLVVPPNYGLFESASSSFIAILREYTPDVEQYSIDEAFLDMSGTELLFGPPVQVANEIKDRIREELGFTVNVGISSNKLLAKMASDFKKPDLVHTLFPEEMPDKMWPLPVSELLCVGRATAKELLKLGIRTIGDLANYDPIVLRKHLKKQGEVIWGFANGVDCSIVEAEPIANKGYGNSTTIAFDVTDSSTAKMVLLALAETVAARLRHNQVKAEVVAVGIKTNLLQYASHQMVLETPTNITLELHKAAGKLFDELWDGSPIRQLGIHTGRMRDMDTARQMDLFDTTDYDKLERLDATVDSIRKKYGIDAVKRAAFVTESNRVDHMSGGISREKRTLDYSKLDIE